MDPQVGRAGLRLAMFMIVMAGGMLLFLHPGTAEFAITVFTLLIGLLFAAIVVAFVTLLPR